MSSRKDRIGMIDKSLILNTSKQCDLLSIHRGGLYYKPVSISEENLSILDFLDKQYLDTPFTVVENWLYNFKR